MTRQINRDEQGRIVSSPVDPNRPLMRSKGIGLFADQVAALASINPDISQAEACRRALDYCLNWTPEIFEEKPTKRSITE